MLSLKLLGGAIVERAGAPVTGRATRGHRLALLALLAGGRTVSRDRALGLLWPDADTDRARRFLSDTLYLLRGTLGEEAVTGAGDDLRLNPEHVTSDVAELERLLDAGQLESAVRLWGGPFLEGFHLAGSAEFEQWADGERARLAARHASALEGLAEASEAEGKWEAAAGWWRRRAALEPANGRVATRLMLALDRAGDRAGALSHARVHAALLRQEYDAEPDAHVTELAERLRREPAVPLVAARPQRAEATVAEAPAAPAGPAVLPRQRSRVGWYAAALALVLLGAAAAWGIAARNPPGDAARSAAPAPAIRQSIAVLPFTNLSADTAHDYFSEGLAEELIGALSRIEGLRVAARTSSFAVGGAGLDVRAIGDTLGVATVLEGSVRRDGGRLRVSARLADAETGYQIWTEEYDRELRDLFDVQDEIAQAIAAALELRLAGAPGGGAARSSPLLEAHDLYLRGVYVRNQLTGDALSRAVDYFDRAIQLDSSYALAYAGKATAIGPLVWYRHLPRAQGWPAMREAARRALELDSTLGEAHVAQGMLEFYFEWDWPAAEREFTRAIALNPSDQHAHHMYANYLVAMGRIDDAIAARRRALELDPLSLRSGLLLARDYLIAGDHERAVLQYRRMMEIDSTSPLALGLGQEGAFGLGEVYERMGRDDDAAREYLRMARLEGIPSADLERLRTAFDAAGLEGYWRARLELELRRPEAAAEPHRIASLIARTGDAEQTAVWLERAWRERSMALVFLGVLPAYDGVRGHPRIRRLLERMRLPVDDRDGGV